MYHDWLLLAVLLASSARLVFFGRLACVVHLVSFATHVSFAPIGSILVSEHY